LDFEIEQQNQSIVEYNQQDKTKKTNKNSEKNHVAAMSQLTSIPKHKQKKNLNQHPIYF